jgi:hypothetical protein
MYTPTHSCRYTLMRLSLCLQIARWIPMFYLLTLRYCMHVCMYVCVYLCMYVCMHACMYDPDVSSSDPQVLYACMYVCAYLCMYVCMYVRSRCFIFGASGTVCMYVCMYVSYVRVYVSYVLTIIDIRTHTHTHTHTQGLSYRWTCRDVRGFACRNWANDTVIEFPETYTITIEPGTLAPSLNSRYTFKVH